jgi:hypothetical protein
VERVSRGGCAGDCLGDDEVLQRVSRGAEVSGETGVRQSRGGLVQVQRCRGSGEVPQWY